MAQPPTQRRALLKTQQPRYLWLAAPDGFGDCQLRKPRRSRHPHCTALHCTEKYGARTLVEILGLGAVSAQPLHDVWIEVHIANAVILPGPQDRRGCAADPAALEMDVSLVEGSCQCGIPDR